MMNHPKDDAIDALLRRQFEGAVADDGFCDRVMEQLPARRRATWPLWAGILAGVAACASSLWSMPLLRAGWRDWAGGMPTTPALAVLLVLAVMALLAMVWSLYEADDR